MSTVDRLRQIIQPIVEDLGLELFDLEFTGSTVLITIDFVAGSPLRDVDAEAAAAGLPRSVDLSDITSVTRAVSRAFDEADPIDAAYSIEVSSPGLERTLRTPVHFAGAVGQTITIKLVPGLPIGRRLKGRLDSADDGAITVTLDPSGESHTIPFGDIEKARTVFVWGPEPKPAKPTPTKPKPKAEKAKAKAKADKPKQKKVTAP